MGRFEKRLQFPFDFMNTIYNSIIEIERINSEIGVKSTLWKQVIKRLKQSVLVTSTWSSNRIEWNRMTDDEVEELYRNMRMKKFRNRDEQEIWWYLEILDLVFSSYDSMTLSENLILELHDKMLSYSDKDIWQRGKYKFWPNRVEARDEEWNLVQVIFNPTEPAMVQIEMQELLQWTKKEFKDKKIHPLFIIANFIFEFLAIHPFQDGNGRISRILTNMLLLQQWFLFTSFVSHEAIVEVNKIEYYKALNKTQQSWKTDNEDISKWLIFFIDVIKQQAIKWLEIYNKQNIEPYLSQIQLKIWNCINEKWLISRKDLSEICKVSYNTVWQVIQKLIKMKKIERIGETSGVKYRSL